MTKKTKLYSLVLFLGIVLIVGSLVYKNGSKHSADILESVTNDEGNNAMNDESNTSMEKVDYLEGTLQKSDDLSRGNLKLITKDSEIYLKTDRDFSSLIGTEVLVNIEGTLDKFKLIDIESQLTKDGFIKSQ